MNDLNPQWIIVIAEGVGILVAIGITWGILRSKVDNLSKEVSELKQEEFQELKHELKIGIESLNKKLDDHDNEFHEYVQEHADVTRDYEGRISFIEAKTNGKDKR